MADEIGSLLVRIDAEDNASAVLARVSGSVSSLSGASAAGAKSVSGLTGAMDAGKTTAESYRSKMADAAKAVSDKKTALDSARTAYKATTKEAERNTTALKSQKNSVESLIRAKQSEIDALEHSNTVINKGSQAYKDNQKAIEWTKTELRDLEAQHKSITQSMDAHEASVAKASRAYETARTEVETAEKTYAKYTSGLDAVEKAEQAAAKAANAKNWEDAGKAIKDVGDGIDTITKPFQYAAVGAIAGGVAVSKAAMDYETAFTGVQKTLDGTPEQLEAVNSEIRQMAKEIPVSAAGLADIAAIGGQLGVGAEDITKFTKTIAAMGVSTDLAGEEGAAALARIQTVTGDTMANVDRTASSIVALGNSTAATESEIAYMAVRMGKYGNTVGMNTQQVLGYSAALSSMGIEAQLGGSAIGRTWLDIETAVNSGGDALEAYAKYAGTTAQEFAQQWSTDPSGAFSGLIKGLSTTENLTQAMADLGIVNTQDQQVVMALANGYDLLADCLTTSSTAYAENTALAKEAGAAYGTTANQIQLAKNDIVDAAISWGDVLLPEIRSGAQWVGDLAEGFGNLDDGTKRAVISGAKTAVVIGGISKATVGAVKGIGGLVEGVGQIKTALSAGGALAKFAPTLTAIGSAAGPVAVGIAAIGTATYGMYEAAKAYEDYRADWSRGGDEMSASLQANIDAVRELNSLQREMDSLNSKIELGELEGEELEQAKARLEEIKQILSEKYNLDINVDSTQLDAAIEKAKQIQLLEARQTTPELLDYADSNTENYTQAKKDAAETERTIAAVEKQKEATKDFRGELLLLDNALKSGTISQEEFNNGLEVLADAAGNPYLARIPTENLLNDSIIDDWYDQLSDKLTDGENGLEAILAQHNASISEFENSMSTLADAGLLEIETGNTETGLRYMETAIKAAGLSVTEYGQRAALAQNQISSFADLQGQSGDVINNVVADYQSAAQQFGATSVELAQGSALIKNGLDSAANIQGPEALNNVLRDFDQYAKQFNLSSGDIALGTSLIQKGFNDLQSAVDAGALDDIFNAFEGNAKAMGMDNSQIIEFANALDMIPENKHIEISADGDLSLVENVTEKVAEIDGQQYTVTVDADGNVTILDEATRKTQTLQSLGAVSIGVNAEGNTVLLDEAGNEVAELKQIGSVNIAVDANGNVTLLDEASQEVQELINNGTVSLQVNASGDGFNVLDQAKNVIGEIKQNGDIEIGVNAKPGNTGILDDIKSWLFPSAEAAEVTVDVNATPGDINMEQIESAISQAANLEGGTINAQADVTVTPGNIDTSAVSSAVTSSVDAVKGNTTVDVTVTATASGAEGVQTLASAINTVQGKNVSVVAAVTGKTETDALRASISAVAGKNVRVSASVSGTAAVNELVSAISQVTSKTVTITANYVTTGSIPEAKGTQNFPGGLAMVNDQKGIPDPRELIIDNGRAFIPQGKDVILPLSKGAKVYTARQTKRIMRNMGIPHYAEGKSNSDAFTAASDDWTHYTKTHAVTVTEELEKWVELSKEYTANIKDAEDIEERLYSLTRDRREELNELSEEYISDRSFFNDWSEWGDSAIEAFDRVRDREYAYVADRKITEKEANDYLAELGKDMYDQRVENSEAWIDKQIRYNDMSVEDTKAAYDRMAAYTQEYYDNGLISYREYIEGMEEIDEQRTERLLDAYNVDDNRAQRYKQMAEVFGFDEGDNLVKTIGRELDNLDKAYADGAFRGSDEDYWDKRADLLIEQRNAEFDEWQTAMDKERTLYDLWDMWDSIGGKTGWLEDYAKQLQKFYADGKMSEKEFRSEMLDVYVEYYNAQEEALDEALQAQSDYIDSVNERYDNLINKKEDAFDMKSLNDDIAEQQRKAEIYEGAVTQRGQDVYSDAVDRLEELQHQKEIKELQAEQTKVVSGLRTDYDKIEQNKKQILNGLSAQFIDVNAIASAIKADTAGTQELFRELLLAVRNIPGGNVYGDTNYNITGADTSILSAFMRRGVNAISGF